MDVCTLCFHGQLLDLMATPNKCGVLAYPLTRRASIKDIIESQGPPHTEIGHISADNKAVDFDFIPQPGQIIGIFPVRPPADPCTPTLLCPTPAPRLQFLVDVNVGKLAKLLRMLGLDAEFHCSWSDWRIAHKALQEGRIVLSKDRGLLKRNHIQWGRLIRGQTPREQLVEVLSFFGIRPPLAIFSRCLSCNTPLQPVDKKDIEHRLKPKTKRFYQRFQICPTCERIYWRGSHHRHMQQWLEETIPGITSSCHLSSRFENTFW